MRHQVVPSMARFDTLLIRQTGFCPDIATTLVMMVDVATEAPTQPAPRKEEEEEEEEEEA